MSEKKHTMSELYQWQSLPLSIKVSMTKRRIRDWVNYYGEEGEPKLLKPALDKRGYCIVNLYDGKGNNKSMKVHRLVALAFLENPDNKKCVCHKDNNPKNNHLSNLYWGTDQENQSQAWEDGLHKSEMPVSQYDKNGGFKKTFKSQSEASRQTGVPQANIWKCLVGERKTAGGFIWRKLD